MPTLLIILYWLVGLPLVPDVFMARNGAGT